ncbi:hypothetical protein GOQ30_01080 [Flavobacterium sp. TP390]|uniref:Uncharacterized protein n=1 Tax=Flavobacterium profundi TaxID=1774945 RepID=A0A6I4IDL9_9FLAO|nr:hypothetical protein [Flavobacterium profundi]MVO07753.1 hypothetical protein [Flavobacterium profundi]
MARQKSNLNWYFIIVGILIFYFGLTNNQETKQTELKKITVELYKDIIHVKGRKSSVDYKFWTKEYKNQFHILKGSITRGKHDVLSRLKGGQMVDLYLTPSDFENLSDAKEDITVIGISVQGNSLLSQDEFFHNQELYRLRLQIFSVFTALMLLLNGLTNIPKKVNYILIGTFTGAIIIMRIFEIGIY